MDRRKAVQTIPVEPDRSNAPGSSITCSHRAQDDDFFCLRYRVWYPSIDCAVRTKFKTSPGCLSCEQGRFNLKRHAHGLARTRFNVTSPDFD